MTTKLCHMSYYNMTYYVTTYHLCMVLYIAKLYLHAMFLGSGKELIPILRPSFSSSHTNR